MNILPKSWRDKVATEQPNRSAWSEEMAALLDPKIEARPLQMPGIMQIRPKDSTVAFHWVRLKRGNSPDSTRYLEMKAAGYTDATLEDCDPLVNAVNVTDEGTKIFCGI